MGIFKVFNNDIKLETLYAPLKHPNIKYEWIEKDIKIENQIHKIIFVGDIIDDGNVNIIEFDGIHLGFKDHNRNFVTTILFHDLNLKKPGYKILLDKIDNCKLKPEEEKEIDVEINSTMKKLIKDLDNDVNFYMDVIAYIRKGKFEFKYEIQYSKEEIDKFISLIRDKGEDISSEYPHLKLMINIL